MTSGAQQVIARRRAQQRRAVDLVTGLAEALPGPLDVRAVVVYGSVARGDFNTTSDIDVLVVASALPDRFLDRFEVLGRPPPRVQLMPWTPDDWRRELDRGNPIAREALERGVWITGSPEGLA